MCPGVRIERVGGVLIVDLPADDVRVMAEALGELLGHGAGEHAVLRVGPVELLAVAVLGFAAVFLCAQRFGVGLGEPRGRCGAGRAMTV